MHLTDIDWTCWIRWTSEDLVKTYYWHNVTIFDVVTNEGMDENWESKIVAYMFSPNDRHILGSDSVYMVNKQTIGNAENIYEASF